ncbi:MAG: response regulator [Bdellovibrionales bacterium]|nr:response regulator [Bdellovibrionales bacterium]
MARILIVDDDEIFRGAVEMSVGSLGHEVTTAANGRIALDALQRLKFDVVISDIRMPEMDGVELLKQIRSQGQLPVILMTGFSEIIETQAAHSLGANEFIPKPFSTEDLSTAINRCLVFNTRSVDESEDFCKLALNDFVTGRTIKFNIFVRLTGNKHIKLAHKGEDISMERIRFYREKGLRFLYLRREDFRQYVGFSAQLNQAARAKGIINTEKKLGLLRHTGEILNEQIRHDGVDEEAFESAQAFVGATVDILTDNPRALDVLDALRNHADYMMVHSVGVSLYSLMIAQRMGWNLPTNRLKVAMGALFHDVGLKEVSRSILDRPRYAWSREEVKVYETHPSRGIAILNDIDCIPEDVREVVKQHHENCLSHGYPAGIRKSNIHPMAKLISVADEFCYRIIKGPEFKDLTPVEALQDLKVNLAEQLDKKFLEALTLLFRPATPVSLSKAT